MNTRSDERLGTERVLPLVLRMALPAVAAQLVNLLYGIVDKIYIGHIEGVGGEALAGVGITTSVILLIAAFSSLVGGGGSPLAAIQLGRGNKEEAGRILNNGFVMLLFFALICTVVPYFIMEPMLDFAGADTNTMPYAKDYLSVYLIGTVFVMISSGLNMFISCQGRPGIAMISVIIGAVLNIALDPLFIFAFGMGVKGAAIATVVSQVVSAAWVLGFLFSEKAELRLELELMKPRLAVMGRITALGISPFVMASTESLVGFTLNGQLKTYGDTTHVAALTAMQSAMQMISIPLAGFGQGVIPVLSYNYGHGKNDRVKECFKIALAVMFGFNFLGMIFMILFPGLIGGMFTDDAGVIAIVKQYMPIFLLGMTIFGLQRTCQNTFVALGQAKVSLFIALLRKVLLLVPLAYLLPLFMGVTGVYAAEAIADATAAILCTTIFILTFPKILKKNEERK
jgi:putative MATE family efflux protein